MSGFRNQSELVAAIQNGQKHTCHLRKVPSQATVAGWWADLSMASGNPKPNYYASSPLVAAVLNGFDGIFHGDDKSPAIKQLLNMSLCTPTAGLVGVYGLLDYLLYYPFIDLDDTDPQTMDNTVPIPRYTDGDGVMAMMVSVAPTIGSGQFTFDYINQDGVQKTSPVQFCSVASASIASIVTSEQGTAAGGQKFLRLASGDTGIRSIVSLQNSVSNGGLGCIVLVKPLATLPILQISMETERSWMNEILTAPQIQDGAYLNMIVNCAASIAAGTLAGRLEFGWN